MTKPSRALRRGAVGALAGTVALSLVGCGVGDMRDEAEVDRGNAAVEQGIDQSYRDPSPPPAETHRTEAPSILVSQPGPGATSLEVNSGPKRAGGETQTVSSTGFATLRFTVAEASLLRWKSAKGVPFSVAGSGIAAGSERRRGSVRLRPGRYFVGVDGRDWTVAVRFPRARRAG